MKTKLNLQIASWWETIDTAGLTAKQRDLCLGAASAFFNKVCPPMATAAEVQDLNACIDFTMLGMVAVAVLQPGEVSRIRIALCPTRDQVKTLPQAKAPSPE
jgi:hypothetical protein